MHCKPFARHKMHWPPACVLQGRLAKSLHRLAKIGFLSSTSHLVLLADATHSCSRKKEVVQWAMPRGIPMYLTWCKQYYDVLLLHRANRVSLALGEQNASPTIHVPTEQKPKSIPNRTTAQVQTTKLDRTFSLHIVSMTTPYVRVAFTDLLH